MTSGLQPPPAARASYPVRDGNAARVLVDGHEALSAIFEAVATARQRVVVTVAFVDIDLPLPGHDCTLIEFLSERAASGIDVRMLFWWSEYDGIGSFRGSPREIERLHELGVRVRMRWDCVPRGCHHQKSYVIDDEVAFVGGINLTREALSSPAHDRKGFHDLFVELRGPAVADVAHNFVQRWNQATETIKRGHAFPSIEDAGPLPLPASPEFVPGRGTLPIQIVRTIRRHIYRGPAGWSRQTDFDLYDGEASIAETVARLIGNATRSIYIENQFLMEPATIRALTTAANRGVEIIAVLPLEPDRNLLLYPADKMRETRAALREVADQPRRIGIFGLVRDDDPATPIYVHSKLLIVDDTVMTLGSANLWPPSYWRDSELNATIEDPALCLATRQRLWREHAKGQCPEGFSDWLDLGAQGAEARLHDKTPPSRIVSIDPEIYYRFPHGVRAPWDAVARSTNR